MIKIKESDVLKQILEYLSLIRVSAWRNNTGAMKIGKGYVKWGLKGSADITGILKDGRRLEIEVKRPKYPKSKSGKAGQHLREQQDFIDMIRWNKGVAGCATCTEDVDRILAGEKIDVI